MPKPHPTKIQQAIDRAAWEELEKATETIQATVTAVLESDYGSIEGQALLARLTTITALQRQMIRAFRLRYLGT